MDGDAVTANGLAIWTTQSEGLMCLLILDLALKVRLSDTSVLTIYAEAIPPVWNQGTSCWGPSHCFNESATPAQAAETPVVAVWSSFGVLRRQVQLRHIYQLRYGYCSGGVSLGRPLKWEIEAGKQHAGSDAGEPQATGCGS